jgi:DMSO/TMAO reductase YedYZ molybdopterin-dependent catalytic subunit
MNDEAPKDPAPESAAGSGSVPGGASAEEPRPVDPVSERTPEAAARSDSEIASSPTPQEPERVVAAAEPAHPIPERRHGQATPDESDESVIEVPRRRLAAQSRRDFLLFAAGVAATATGAWWLLPDRTKARLLPGAARDRLDSMAARIGLTRENRERTLNRALTFDDDVAEALFSKDRRVRTYSRSEVTRLRNNYMGRTPGPEYLATWGLTVSGLASGRTLRFGIADLLGRFQLHDEITRLVCVEGWSAIAWFGGIRFADLLAAYPPAAGARWAALRSTVNLDGAGRPMPYYVSLDLETARHRQTLLATHKDGQPLPIAHGAPLRLRVPVKLGLKNIKAITEINYSAEEPPDFWNERGYSRYDGL